MSSPIRLSEQAQEVALAEAQAVRALASGEEYRERLAKAGVEVTPVINHDASENQASRVLTPSTFVRSIYFLDPDGIQLEFAAWTREMNDDDVNCEPHSTAAG